MRTVRIIDIFSSVHLLMLRNRFRFSVNPVLVSELTIYTLLGSTPWIWWNLEQQLATIVERLIVSEQGSEFIAEDLKKNFHVFFKF